MIGVESAEGISWKKGFRYFFDSVRPTLCFRKKRQKLLITFRAKGVGDTLFVARFDVQRKPCRRVDFGHVLVGRFACITLGTAADRLASTRNRPQQSGANVAGALIQLGLGDFASTSEENDGPLSKLPQGQSQRQTCFKIAAPADPSGSTEESPRPRGSAKTEIREVLEALQLYTELG